MKLLPPKVSPPSWWLPSLAPPSPPIPRPATHQLLVRRDKFAFPRIVCFFWSAPFTQCSYSESNSSFLFIAKFSSVVWTHSSRSHLMAVWIVSTVWLLWLEQLWTLTYKSWCGWMHLLLSDASWGKVYHHISGWCHFKTLSNHFPKWLTHLTFPAAVEESSNCSMIYVAMQRA